MSSGGGHPQRPPLTAEERAATARLVQILREGPPSESTLKDLLAVASEPKGVLRKVALDVLGHVCRGDASVAVQLAGLLEARITEPRIGRFIAQALGKIGVPSEPVLAVLVRARKFKTARSAMRVHAKKALGCLGRADLVFG
jgi:hypothetical protein